MFRSRTFLAAVLIEAFFFLPLGIYLFFADTAWSLMYFADPDAMTTGGRTVVGVLSMEGYFLAILAGNLAAQACLRRQKDRAAEGLLGATLAGLGVLTLFTWKRLMEVGTYAAYLAGTGESLLSHPISRIVGVGGAPLFVVLAAVVLKFLADDRKTAKAG